MVCCPSSARNFFCNQWSFSKQFVWANKTNFDLIISALWVMNQLWNDASNPFHAIFKLSSLTSKSSGLQKSTNPRSSKKASSSGTIYICHNSIDCREISPHIFQFPLICFLQMFSTKITSCRFGTCQSNRSLCLGQDHDQLSLYLQRLDLLRAFPMQNAYT